MNFFAMPTLKKVRACLRLPSSMMPRFSLKLTLARLRTGIASVGSLLRSAAVTTVSATPISFFSTVPAFFAALATSALPYLLGLRAAGGLRGASLAPGVRPAGWRAPGRFRLGRRGRGLGRRGTREHGGLALRAFGGHDDRVRQPLGPAVLADDLVGARAAGALERDAVELVLQLLLRQLAALEAGAGLDDLLDVELEDVAPAELALGPLAAAQEHAEPAPALLERQLDLLADLVVVGDRFLRLAGERHPHRGHVDEHDHGPGGQGPPRLADAVVLPRGLEGGL